ncbi:RNA recognition motif containing protein [Gracilaria domingensis]|nr:RNA recognition motif containing protein [Gracilaria domingensis]
MGRPPGTTVFVGNISYDTTEEQLNEVFSQVGNVVNFRLMHDNETGRAKGYGFCEYEDKETAMSARRNLNGTMLNGRPLRVDFTDSDKQIAARNGPNLNPNLSAPPNKPGVQNIPQKPAHQMPNHPNMQPAGLPPALASANPSMERMSLPEIHQTMVHLKKAIVQNPNEMRDLLLANPRLAQAIMQGQLMLGMVPPPMMPTPQSHPPMQPRPPPQPRQRPPPSAPPRNQPPPRNKPPPRNQPPPPLAHVAPPAHVNAAPPPQNGPPPQPNMPHGGMQMPGPGMPFAQGMGEQEAFLQRVMSMTPEEISQLPADYSNYVMELKQVLAMHGAGGLNPGMNQPMPPGMPPGGPHPPQPQKQFR